MESSWDLDLDNLIMLKTKDPNIDARYDIKRKELRGAYVYNSCKELNELGEYEKKLCQEAVHEHILHATTFKERIEKAGDEDGGYGT